MFTLSRCGSTSPFTRSRCNDNKRHSTQDGLPRFLFQHTALRDVSPSNYTLSQTSTQSTKHVFPLLQPAVSLLNCFFFHCCSFWFVLLIALIHSNANPTHYVRFTLLTLVTFRRYNKISQRHIARERDSAVYELTLPNVNQRYMQHRYIWGGCDILCSMLHQFSAIRWIIPTIYYSEIAFCCFWIIFALRQNHAPRIQLHNTERLSKVSKIY